MFNFLFYVQICKKSNKRTGGHAANQGLSLQLTRFICNLYYVSVFPGPRSVDLCQRQDRASPTEWRQLPFIHGSTIKQLQRKQRCLPKFIIPLV